MIRSLLVGLLLLAPIVSTIAVPASASNPVASSPAAWAAEGGGLAVEGIDRARVLAPAGASIESYSNLGYRLRVEDGEARIEVDASPVGSRSRFEPPAEPESGDAIGRLAHSVTTGARTDYEAVNRVLTWVARNIEYRLDRQQSQEATAVLERRTAYCTGVARLTVALVRALGLEAREVAGFVVGESAEGPRGFHRWIEVRFPDVGWVFSDPLYSHHYVPANYLRLSSETLVPDEGMEGLLLARQNTVVPIDIYPGSIPGIRSRRNTDRRWAAALHVEVESRRTRGLAILEGNSHRWRHSLVEGTATFLGLDPGSYRLRLMIAGHGVVERRLEVFGRQRTTIFLGSDEPDPARPPARSLESSETVSGAPE